MSCAISGSSSTTRICDMEHSDADGLTREPDGRSRLECRSQVRCGPIPRGRQRTRGHLERDARSSEGIGCDLERDAAEYSLVPDAGQRNCPAIAEDQRELIAGANERIVAAEILRGDSRSSDQLVTCARHQAEEAAPGRVLCERPIHRQRML